ncbi:MAG: 2OG-Fe(II) oxygenase [Methylobacter sp.]
MSVKKSVNPFDRIPPYRIIPNFLGNDLIDHLLEHARARELDFVSTRVGKEQRIDPKIRVSQVLRDFGSLREELDERFRAVMSDAITDLRITPFGLAKCEIEMVAHNNGAFYKQHIDTRTGHLDEKTQRVLTGVLYFHSVPKGFSGGQLRLHAFSSPEEREHFVDIEPERDNFVLFPSWAPHEVLPISCPSVEFAQSRFAINCWYRRANPHKGIPSE